MSSSFFYLSDSDSGIESYKWEPYNKWKRKLYLDCGYTIRTCQVDYGDTYTHVPAVISSIQNLPYEIQLQKFEQFEQYG